MRRMLLLGLLAFLPLMASAATDGEARKQVEANMELRGEITVGTDGGVDGYGIDQQDKVGETVLAFVKRNIEHWKFEPAQANGNPAIAKNRMYLNLVAKPRDDGNFDMRLAAVVFRPLIEARQSSEEKAWAAEYAKTMKPPYYPVEAMKFGMQGTVYLVLKVGQDGDVEDAYAEKVNLRFLGDEKTMERARNLFAKASIDAARKWKRPDWVQDDSENRRMRVPVEFELSGGKKSYGQWRPYVPGPTQRAPWQSWEDATGFAPDALPADGGAFPVGETGTLKLLTPLGG